MKYGNLSENRFLSAVTRIKYIIVSLLFFSTLPLHVFAQVLNKGVGGNNTVQLLQRMDEDVILEHPDLVILMVGTNDLLNSRKMISYSEYADNLHQIVSKIKSEGSQVLLMSPPPVDSAYLFTRHDKTLYVQSPNEILNSARHIVQQLAKDKEALFLDLYAKFSTLGLPRHDEDLFIRNPRNSGISDGVHPTALGYHFIAEQIFQFLKEHKLIKRDMKIICFGDSITNGAGVDKEKSYPSVLAQLIYDHEIE